MYIKTFVKALKYKYLMNFTWRSNFQLKKDYDGQVTGIKSLLKEKAIRV